ncbi:response regulator transcription factor [Pedobacter gandavensis]|uniref:response regulator transcription factor n=1 Tax=Pedobacter gandavensis TaxID=2679963 RepID=UPI00292E9C6B|nr:response regulator transcription factor [Pedobacter gandavensis]
MKQHILFVEDERDLGNVVKQYLELVGFEVTWCLNAHDAFDAYKISKFHMLIVDVQLVDSDGFELVEKIKKLNKNQSFIFLTARNEKNDRLRGLKIGADDYIVKPFDIDELVLRIKNILKRNEPLYVTEEVSATSNELRMGDLIFKKDLLKLFLPNNSSISLTLREAQLLEYMFLHQNRILKRADILLELWGENDYFLGRSLDVFISRLRKALNHSSEVSIQNVYGVGYIFSIAELLKN